MSFQVTFDKEGKAHMGNVYFDDWREAQRFIFEYNNSPSVNATLLNDLQARVRDLEKVLEDIVSRPLVIGTPWHSDDLCDKLKQESVLIEENPFPRHTAEEPESVTLADDIERSENPIDKAARAYVAGATEEVRNLLGPDPDELVVCYDKGEPEHFLEPGHTAVIPCNTAAHEDVPDLKFEKANAVAEAVTQKREETGLIKTDNKDECFEELQKMHKPSGLTIKDLAKGIGAPYSTVQSWFNNKNRTSLKEKLPKLRKFYAEQAKVERTLMSFYCNVCGASFPSLAALTGHKSSHSHIKTLTKPAEPAKPQFNRPYWATPPENYSPESFRIDWNTCAQVISEAGNATSYENLVNRIADRVLSEDRAFQILVRFDHLFQAARTAKNEGGEAVRNAKIEAQKELMSIAKEGKVAFG